MLCLIPTLMVLSFFINSRILPTGILQTGPNQFVENQNQNQDNTGRFGMKSLPKRLEFFLLKRLYRNVLFPCQVLLGTPPFDLLSTVIRVAVNRSNFSGRKD